jgi:hypothetical protein
MREIGVDRSQIIATLRGFQELPSHLHQKGGATWCEVETPKEFLASRLDSSGQLNGRLAGRFLSPGFDGGGETRVIRSETGCERFEKSQTRIGGGMRELRQHVASEGDAGEASPRRESRSSQRPMRPSVVGRTPPRCARCRIDRPRTAIEWSRSAKKDVCMWRNPTLDGVADIGGQPRSLMCARKAACPSPSGLIAKPRGWPLRPQELW